MLPFLSSKSVLTSRLLDVGEDSQWQKQVCPQHAINLYYCNSIQVYLLYDNFVTDWLNYWEQPSSWYFLRNSLNFLQYNFIVVASHFSLVGFCSTHVCESKRYSILKERGCVSVVYNLYYILNNKALQNI